MPVNPPGFTTMLEDTTIIRFNFISDSVETNKEGWMIDHIRLISYLLMGSVDDYQKVDFSISPNPIRESAQLEFNKIYQKIHLQVYSLSGQLISEQDYFNTQSIHFDRKKINEGSYLLKLTFDQKEFGIKKIVIQ